MPSFYFFLQFSPKCSQDSKERINLYLWSVTSIFSADSSIAIRELFTSSVPLIPEPNLHRSPDPSPDLDPHPTAHPTLQFSVLVSSLVGSEPLSAFDKKHTSMVKVGGVASEKTADWQGCRRVRLRAEEAPHRSSLQPR